MNEQKSSIALRARSEFYLIPRGWELWKQALEFDKKSLVRESKSSFEASAKAFFDDASGEKAVITRALLEYSTLMDAFSSVQEGRLLKEA
ncbi:MAG TPA: hypothetical protein VED17_09895, partial [Nitrososphaerales archaeon]|nr:hypothetical protein [Nitrososphaerales archaeon]